jgi:hypothetical protein
LDCANSLLRSTRVGWSRSIHDDLPLDEAELLECAGLAADSAQGEKPSDPLARSIADFMALRTVGSWSIDEVAKRLDVDSSRIRQRLAEKTLYGIAVDNRWRIPKFQFEKRSVIPNLGDVIRALPADLSAIEFMRWFNEPDADLESSDVLHPISPRDWLRLGKSAERLAKIAADL